MGWLHSQGKRNSGTNRMFGAAVARRRLSCSARDGDSLPADVRRRRPINRGLNDTTPVRLRVRDKPSCQPETSHGQRNGGANANWYIPPTQPTKSPLLSGSQQISFGRPLVRIDAASAHLVTSEIRMVLSPLAVD